MRHRSITISQMCSHAVSSRNYPPTRKRSGDSSLTYPKSFPSRLIKTDDQLLPCRSKTLDMCCVESLPDTNDEGARMVPTARGEVTVVVLRDDLETFCKYVVMRPPNV